MKQSGLCNNKATNIQIKPYFNFNLLFPSNDRTYSINRYDYELMQELNYVNGPNSNQNENLEKFKKHKKRQNSGDAGRIKSSQKTEHLNQNPHIKYPCFDDSNERLKDLFKINKSIF